MTLNEQIETLQLRLSELRYSRQLIQEEMSQISQQLTPLLAMQKAYSRLPPEQQSKIVLSVIGGRVVQRPA